MTVLVKMKATVEGRGRKRRSNRNTNVDIDMILAVTDLLRLSCYFGTYFPLICIIDARNDRQPCTFSYQIYLITLQNSLGIKVIVRQMLNQSLTILLLPLSATKTQT